MANEIGQAPIFDDDFSSRRWKDWFARLNDFLDVQDLIIARETVNNVTSWTSPDLEENFMYDVDFLFNPNSDFDDGFIRLIESDSEINGNDYESFQLVYTGATASGTPTASTNANASNIGQITTSTDTAQKAVGNFRIYKIRDSSEKTVLQGIASYYDDNNNFYRTKIFSGRRDTAADAEKFRFLAGNGTTDQFDLSVVVRRRAFEV